MEKHVYKAVSADTQYRETLSESRSGLSLTESELKHLDSVISPLIRKGQSLNHICVNNQDSFMVSESTLYRLIHFNVFSARNIDLPRKVRYKNRAIRLAREYADKGYCTRLDLPTLKDYNEVLLQHRNKQKKQKRYDKLA